MESLSQNNVGPPTPRPALSLSANTAAALHEGRVVAGEVIQSLAGGSVLVAIGNLRVPARAQVALEPGQRFMATVETTGEVVVLRVHSGERASGASALLEALRARDCEDGTKGKEEVEEQDASAEEALSDGDLDEAAPPPRSERVRRKEQIAAKSWCAA